MMIIRRLRDNQKGIMLADFMIAFLIFSLTVTIFLALFNYSGYLRKTKMIKAFEILSFFNYTESLYGDNVNWSIIQDNYYNADEESPMGEIFIEAQYTDRSEHLTERLHLKATGEFLDEEIILERWSPVLSKDMEP